MKKALIIFLLCCLMQAVSAQKTQVDSLKKQLIVAKTDTDRLRTLSLLARATWASKPDSSIAFSQQCYELANKLDNLKYKANSLVVMADAYGTMGDYAKSIVLYFKALTIFESSHDNYRIASIDGNISIDYIEMKDYKTALFYSKETDRILRSFTPALRETARVKSLEMITSGNIGECYLFTGKLDSAEYDLQKTYRYAEGSNDLDMKSYLSRDLGELAVAREQNAKAMPYFKDAVVFAQKANDVQAISMAQLSIGNLYQKLARGDSAIAYAQKALVTAQSGNFKQDALNALVALSGYYDKDRNLPEALKYYKLATAFKDSLFSQDKTRQLVSAGFEERQRRLEIVAAQEKYRDQVRMYVLIGGVLVLLFIVAVFWHNSRQRKKANRLLQTQKEEIATALSQLEQTKDQLIQAEKMASLGELTAGIAHEIQNPLNFVNNFSEVNVELIDELQIGLEKGDLEEVRSIAIDLQENEKKINMHGKRADSIVKGMLEHSRVSTGQKEPTDLNKLADEYLRLAYHGLRVKDKRFNTELLTRFDETLPLVSVVPQDMGRVLLNLFNNAFYAVSEKRKTGGPDYKPLVEVITTLNKQQIEITVKDNGPGVPNTIKDKIMQPFFTTKPTGEGTGLGLSLSYDIIVKGHGGKIHLANADQGGATFIITLPVS